MSAPAIGGPVKHAIDMKEKHMPVLMPIFDRSFVRLAHDAGMRLWTPAPKNP
jgi:hypothetical protein